MSIQIDEVASIEAAAHPLDRPSIYILKVREHLSQERAVRIKAHWDEAWKQAGAQSAPVVIILDGGMDILSLPDACLSAVGLMRKSDG